MHVSNTQQQTALIGVGFRPRCHNGTNFQGPSPDWPVRRRQSKLTVNGRLALRQRWRLARLAAVLLTVLAAVGCTERDAKPSADAIRTSTDQSRKTAQIVGTATCLECHSEKAEPFASSGHSQTLHAAADVSFREKLDGLQWHDPVRDIDFHYFASADDVSTSIPSMFGESRFPLQFGFGSGQHAVTFMTLLEDPDGQPIGIEHRMSWYGHDDGPGETPQPNLQHPKIDAEFFGKAFHGESLDRCFFCHTTSATIVGSEVRDLRPNVGCEKCHGPGSSHVHAVNEGLDDLSIDFASNAKRRPDEIQVCGKCHRTAEMLPANQISPANRLLVRFQPAGLVQSPCYLKSEGRLRCSTCHDPHEHASRRPRRQQIETCLSCHQPEGEPHQIACPISPKDKCISCHMPPVEIRDGISFHDHWIRVRQSEAEQESFAPIPHKQ